MSSQRRKKRINNYSCIVTSGFVKAKPLDFFFFFLPGCIKILMSGRFKKQYERNGTFCAFCLIYDTDDRHGNTNITFGVFDGDNELCFATVTEVTELTISLPLNFCRV